MKIKRAIFCVIVLILMTASVNIDTASAATLPPNEPWTKEFVDRYPGSEVGTNLSIAHHPRTGRAYISYYDSENGDLWMANEVNPGTGNCPNNDDWDCTLVTSTNDRGRFSSIDVVYVRNSTFPVLSYTKIGIAFYDATSRSLKYAQYRSNVFPPSWTLYSVDAPGFSSESRGTYTSMKFNHDNQAVIAYHAQNSDPEGFPYGAVKLAQYKGSNGTGCNGGSPTWSCEVIDQIEDASNTENGSYVSLDIDYIGLMSVAFYNSEENSLVWAWPLHYVGSCSSGEWQCLTIDDGRDIGKFISLHEEESDTDVLRIAYYDSYNGDLRYAEYVGSSAGNCTLSSFDCYVVDHVGKPRGNFGLSMDVDSQGYPIIAYMDAHEELAPTQLRIARPAIAYGLDHGNCGADPDTLWLNWQCTTIDGGASFADETAYVGVSVSPAGLATIAYSENNQHDYETYLKVAQQHFTTYLPAILK